ncbi:hypothetical protein D3C81_1338910 [compost metagenome]
MANAYARVPVGQGVDLRTQLRVESVGFGLVVIDDQHIILALEPLIVGAKHQYMIAGQFSLAFGLHTPVGEAPIVVVIDDFGAAALPVVDAGITRVPVVDMAFDEVAQALIDGLLEGRRGDLLHAVVSGLVVVDRAGEIEVGVGVLVKQLQPRIIVERLNRLAAERGDFVSAILAGIVFHVAVAIGLVTVGDVVTDVRQQTEVAEAVSEDILDAGVFGGAAKAVDA